LIKLIDDPDGTGYDNGPVCLARMHSKVNAQVGKLEMNLLFIVKKFISIRNPCPPDRSYFGQVGALNNENQIRINQSLSLMTDLLTRQINKFFLPAYWQADLTAIPIFIGR